MGTPYSKKTLWVMLGLGIWLTCLFILVSWYQANYIRGFTEDSPEFLNADFSEQWLKDLTPFLPAKGTETRIIQFWQPDCLCNRFALPHSANIIQASHEKTVEHITLIPKQYSDRLESLQLLNPKTTIIAIEPSVLAHWPSSPSVLIEGPVSQLLYIGPLGYGAFCSQSSIGVIEQILSNLDSDQLRPYFNVIGKGCFCPWNK